MSIEFKIGTGGTVTALEQAVRAWVAASVTAMGGDANNVYFADQGFPDNPDVPRVTISIDGPYNVGVDGQTHKYDGAAAAGEEVILKASGNRELVVKLQAFAPVTVGSNITARSLLLACQQGLEVPSLRYALNQAGLGVLVPGDVIRLPKVISGRHEDRAALDSRFSVRQEVTERTGYFDHAKIDGTVTHKSDEIMKD